MPLVWVFVLLQLYDNLIFLEGCFYGKCDASEKKYTVILTKHLAVIRALPNCSELHEVEVFFITV
jgi:hypothetical protein